MSRHRAQRISVYNHKGGVGKTTLTVNIAAALAVQGNRVLLVDSDPQCNLTSYLIEDKVVDELLDKSDKASGRTLWTALKPIVEASGGVNDIEPYERSGLYLLPGDIRLSEYESVLNDFWGDCVQRKVRGFRGTSSLSALVNKCAKDWQIDYVFYDTGPNIGPLNRVILLDCDYFIVPAACDLFSVRALKTLGQTLVKWISSWESILDLAPADTYLMSGKPTFLGYVPQNFRVYGQDMTRPHSYYLAQIERHIFSDIIAALKDLDPALIESGSVTSAKLGEVKNFSSLVQLAQTQGLPLWAVSGGNAKNKQEAKEAFAAIAKRIAAKLG
jgi:cellulose biosynthesis protein BcsQ